MEVRDRRKRWMAMAMAWMDGNLYTHTRKYASITSTNIINFIDFMLEIDTILYHRRFFPRMHACV
jgi:hypothetical protein